MPQPPLKALRQTAVMTARNMGKQGFGVVHRFRQFLIRGNVLEIAVGMVIATAFTSVLESFVRDIFTPILSLIGGKEGLTFSEKHVVMYSAESGKTYNTREEAVKDGAITLDYGQFLQTLLQFLIAAVAMFLLINLVQPIFQEKEEPKTECPYCKEKIPLSAVKCRACATALGVGAAETHLFTPSDHRVYPEAH